MDWERALKNEDRELAKKLHTAIFQITVGDETKIKKINWELLASKIGYPYSNMFKPNGEMNSHCRRVFTELAILANTGKCFYKNMCV